MLTPERVTQIREDADESFPLGNLTDSEDLFAIPVAELRALLDVWEAANEWLMSEDETALRKALGGKE